MPVPATFMASPIAFDGKLLLTSIDGDTYVIKAGPVHEVIATNSIGEPAASTPSISQGRILVTRREAPVLHQEQLQVAR